VASKAKRALSSDVETTARARVGFMDRFAAYLRNLEASGHKLRDPYSGLSPAVRAMRESEAQEDVAILAVARHALLMIDQKRTLGSKGGHARAFPAATKGQWIKQAKLLRKRKPHLSLHAVAVHVARSISIGMGERRPAPRTIYEHLRKNLSR
jgi:hypothetical protein